MLSAGSKGKNIQSKTDKSGLGSIFLFLFGIFVVAIKNWKTRGGKKGYIQGQAYKKASKNRACMRALV